MGRFFGTDGMRGIAGEYPLDASTLFQLGAGLALILRRDGLDPRVVIGRDTRASGAWMERRILDGLASQGGTAELAGIFTTPGISYLAHAMGFGAGVVISASHNPYRDNGVKVIGNDGMKLSDAEEEDLEALLAADPDGGATLKWGTEPATGFVPAYHDLFARGYQDFLCRAACTPARRYRVVIDCANGAAFRIAPAVFRELGHEVIAIHDQPDGTNINLNCGSTHPQAMSRAVVDQRADLGVAFDGDADRVIFADHTGREVDGDQVLYVLACYFKKSGTLAGDLVVTTTMANQGLEVALHDQGIALERTQVGDRYVLQQMLQSGAILGGEQSGHVLLLHRAVAGDGILTALEVINVMQASGKTLSELAAPMPQFPQLLLNVSVSRKPNLEELPAVRDAILAAQSRLGDEGRVLVRYSGTESLARVMVQAREEPVVREVAHHIAQKIQDAIG